jgi:hypothetical protein
MATRSIFIDNTLVNLDPAQLIQSGGEGMVFGWGSQAVKVYHQYVAGREAKVRDLIGLAGRLPGNVFGPCKLALNDTGQVVGVAMARLPAGSQPLRQLANRRYCLSAGLDIAHILPLLQDIHRTLDCLHRLGMVVGDLNDHNLFFDPAAGRLASFWVDVDSYQFNGYSCPVAMESFLDPALYMVQDFSQKPFFTPLTDWYAYWVLLVRSLLGVHPYGGVHRTHKTLRVRATAAVSILAPDVTYPPSARPPESLSDDLLHQFHLIFDKGQRHPLDAGLLDRYAAGLCTCADCGLTYPGQRPGCPRCRRQTPVLLPVIQQGALTIRRLLQVDGHIVYLAAQAEGHILVIARSGSEYRLIRAGVGGKLDEMVLFTGRAGYRFGCFDHYLVVNPAGGRQLLVLDISGPSPRRVALVETAAFRDEAVFAVTAHCLYRIAGGYILRGRVQNGSLLEEMVADARRDQTQLWASPRHETVAGLYRLFDQHHFFIIDGKGATREIRLPAQAAGESVIGVEALVSDQVIAFLLQIGRGGQISSRYLVTDGRGQLRYQREHPAGEAPHYETLTGKTLVGATLLHPTDDGILKENERGLTLLADSAGYAAHGDGLYSHPAGGVLVQRGSGLYLLT